MDKQQFASARRKPGKTQRELAEILVISIKAVHSYEQGWREIPAHIERQLLFLLSIKDRQTKEEKPCWVVRDCPSEHRDRCPAIFHCLFTCFFRGVGPLPG